MTEIIECTYPLMPNKDGLIYSKEEMTHLMEQFVSQPFISLDSPDKYVEEIKDIDVYLPIGQITEVGAYEKGIAFRIVMLDPLKNYIETKKLKWKLEPRLIGIIDNKDGSNYVCNSRVIKLNLLLGEK